ncbi:MAG: nitroreductase [Corynebacteriales bacterium]|nr:nitroreductase [Mycobacteriales bacterium]
MSVSHEVRRIGDLSRSQLENLVAAATAAPSMHNTQPWRFRITGSFIEIQIDPQRALPAEDPQGWTQRLACGAALFNLRMALMSAGFAPKVNMGLAGQSGAAVAQVALGDKHICPPWAQELADAITKRHTVREPFVEALVPADVQAKLQNAAHEEGADLRLFDDSASLTEIGRLIHAAHFWHVSDDASAQELRAWTGKSADDREGVPSVAAGPDARPSELLDFRDFSRGEGRSMPLSKGYESRPLIGILSVPSTRNVDDVYAGQAMQRVLLAATAHGLVASFLSEIVEVPETAARLAERFLSGHHPVPRMVLRMGYGTAAGHAKRRDVSSVIIDERVAP